MNKKLSNNIFRTFIIGVVCAGALGMNGCYSLEHTQKEWVGDGEETIYLGRLDSLYTRSGMNRVEIVGDTRYLRTATICQVSYDDTVLTYKVADIVNNDGTASILVDNLEGGSYYFTVTMLDDEGNKSVPSTVFGQAYGETDLLLETPRRIVDISPKPDGSVVLTWNSASSTYVILTYQDADGNTQTIKLDDDPATTTIDSWMLGGLITATTYIQKNEDDLDMLELETLEYYFPSEIQEAIPRFNLGSAMNMGSSSSYGLKPTFTVELRIRFTELVSGAQNIISCDASGCVGFIFRNDASRIEFYIGSTAGWQGISYSAVETGTWYDIAFSYESNGYMRLYVNGTEVSSRTCAIMNDSPNAIQAGASPQYSDRYMRGDIQHISIWNIVRTAEQIQADYEQGYNFEGTEEGLEAYWPMTVNYGSPLEDKTGKHSATFTNITWNPVN
jgi:hypothetical protein